MWASLLTYQMGYPVVTLHWYLPFVSRDIIAECLLYIILEPADPQRATELPHLKLQQQETARNIHR